MHIQKLLVQSLQASSALKKVTSSNNDERPIVFWHGFGDSYNSTAMQRVVNVVKDSKPGAFMYSVKLDDDDSKDQRLSMFSDVNVDIDYACEQLRDIPALATGFDMIGFSQGGLFARAAIERCALPVETLITFGSPHTGISDLPACADGDWVCKRRNALLLRSGNIWNHNTQTSIVPAQYFRRQQDYDRYIESSMFLADVNNERGDKNSTYVENMKTLERLILIQFTRDETVVPKCTAWFCDLDSEGNVLDFNETRFYKEDLVGLKALYDEDKIEFLSVDDRHMSFSDEYLKELVQKYLVEKC